MGCDLASVVAAFVRGIRVRSVRAISCRLVSSEQQTLCRLPQGEPEAVSPVDRLQVAWTTRTLRRYQDGASRGTGPADEAAELSGAIARRAGLVDQQQRPRE